MQLAKFFRISTLKAEISMNLRATILAAGVGRRLGNLGRSQPKGLIEIGGEPIVYRSIRLLREAGIGDISIVVGHKAEMYERAMESFSSIQLIHNREFSSGGSMSSLALAAEWAGSDLIVLDSDIVYGSECIPVLMGCGESSALLVSGLTGAGDEVWVYGDVGRVEKISKTRFGSTDPVGEFVGISKLGREILDEIPGTRVGLASLQTSEYEDFISESCRDYPVAVCFREDLVWGEIDTKPQLARVKNDVFPRLRVTEGQGEIDSND